MRIVKAKKTPRWLSSVAAVAATCAATSGLHAQNSDPLLDLFIKKGFVTEDEAARVKAEADASRTNEVPTAVESKWKISKGLKSVELYGDLRFRYEDRSATDPNGGSIGLQRFRYSFRLGLRGEALDDFYYGFRLDPSGNPRSAWLTFGTSSSGTPYQGPFGKSTASINVGQAYLGWRPEDWVDLTIGKMPNPLYTTAMVWDPDLSPEGAAERFKYTVGEADLFATFGQFIYQDTNPTQTSPGYFNLGYNKSNIPFLFAWQGGINYHITKQVSLKVAPVLYDYSALGANSTSGSTFVPDFSGTFVGQGSTNGVSGAPAFYNLGGNFDGFVANQTGINNLLVLEVPWELNIKLDDLSVRFFGDYAQNLAGADRANAAYTAERGPLYVGTPGLMFIQSPQTHDDKAYQVGFAVGNKDSLGLVTGATCYRHAWEFRTYWQHIEQYALDPNLLDSDFFEGRGNLEGIYAAFAYGFSQNVSGTIRYGYARRINKNLGTGGSNQDIPQMNPISEFNLLQMDMSLKF